ncbi:TVP38/TMEM64 family protein [Bacillus sp. 2205SS5-2]|uniref:TVP38/TMEM64 family protein n=1 Tax=Bacillus sp. 2205SS5-2 TaxID=3109031 RepID=UPI003004B4DA
METHIINWFESSGAFAVWFSLLINIVISVIGVVPSVFVTAANLHFFGFEQGLLLSIAGEACGAIISFYLYRLGVNRFFQKFPLQHPYLIRLRQSSGMDTFFLIVALRVLPMIPSGAVTLAGAASSMGILLFSLASTLGKIPSLLIEAYSIQQVLSWTGQGKLILAFVSLGIVFLLIQSDRK